MVLRITYINSVNVTFPFFKWEQFCGLLSKNLNMWTSLVKYLCKYTIQNQIISILSVFLKNLPSADLLPQNPWQLGQKETRTWKFSWASRMGSKDPIVWNITCCLSGCTSAKRVKLGGGPGTWTQASELGDTGVPKSMLTMAPNTHPYIVSIFRDASYSIAS